MGVGEKRFRGTVIGLGSTALTMIYIGITGPFFVQNVEKVTSDAIQWPTGTTVANAFAIEAGQDVGYNYAPPDNKCHLVDSHGGDLRENYESGVIKCKVPTNTKSITVWPKTTSHIYEGFTASGDRTTKIKTELGDMTLDTKDFVFSDFTSEAEEAAKLGPDWVNYCVRTEDQDDVKTMRRSGEKFHDPAILDLKAYAFVFDGGNNQAATLSAQETTKKTAAEAVCTRSAIFRLKAASAPSANGISMVLCMQTPLVVEQNRWNRQMGDAEGTVTSDNYATFLEGVFSVINLNQAAAQNSYVACVMDENCANKAAASETTLDSFKSRLIDYKHANKRGYFGYVSNTIGDYCAISSSAVKADRTNFKQLGVDPQYTFTSSADDDGYRAALNEIKDASRYTQVDVIEAGIYRAVTYRRWHNGNAALKNVYENRHAQVHDPKPVVHPLTCDAFLPVTKSVTEFEDRFVTHPSWVDSHHEMIYMDWPDNSEDLGPYVLEHMSATDHANTAFELPDDAEAKCRKGCKRMHLMWWFVIIGAALNFIFLAAGIATGTMWVDVCLWSFSTVTTVCGWIVYGSAQYMVAEKLECTFHDDTDFFTGAETSDTKFGVNGHVMLSGLILSQMAHLALTVAVSGTYFDMKWGGLRDAMGLTPDTWESLVNIF